MKKALLTLLITALLLNLFSWPTTLAAPKLNAPAHFTATAPTHDSIQLSWDKVPGATGYVLYYLSSGSYKELKTVSETRYTDSDSLQAETTYSYKVRAYATASGKSIYSNYSQAVTITTPIEGPGSLVAELLPTRKIQLSWDANKRASGYAIYRSNASDRDFKLLGNTATCNYTDQTVQENQTYYYKVRFFIKKTDKMTYSGFSTTETISTAPQLPLNILADDLSDNSIRLTWDIAGGFSGVVIYRSDSKSGNYHAIKATSDTSFIDTKLKSNANYYYKFKTYNAIGNHKYYSRFSEIATAKTLPKGEKYLRVMFIGSSLIYAPATQEKFYELAKMQHKRVKLYQDMIGGSSLDMHVDLYKNKGTYQFERATADIVVLLQTYMGDSDQTIQLLTETESLFNKNARFYNLPATIGSPTLDAIKRNKVVGVPNLINLKNDYAYYYLLPYFSPEDFLMSDGHPNGFVGCFTATLIYCTLYNEDVMTLPDSFFMKYPEVPGDTDAAKKKSILLIKQAVSKALKEKE